MRLRTMLQFLPTLLLICALTACVPIPAPAASEAASEASKEEPTASSDAITETVAGETGGVATGATEVVPLDAAECEAIQSAIATRLGLDLTVTTTDFASEVANMQGSSCTISATGTGKEFGNFVDVAQAIREIFTTGGWTENQFYQADGPTGTASGYQEGDKTAFVHVDWEPSEEANCPTDQPISACSVEPIQQIFTLVVELAQTS